MPKVIPLRGIRYDPACAGDPADLITPPFDVITPQQQEAFYRRSPFNMVRLILGKKTDFDTRSHNPHTRAAQTLRQWLDAGVLRRDPEPCFYLTAIDFVFEGHRFQRLGLIAAVRLSSFEAGEILPHERTFTNVKSERLALMKQCHANFSPIFSLFPDNHNLHAEFRTVSEARQPQVDFTDADSIRHRLWCIVNPVEVTAIAERLAPGPFYIADGHHRYETALNYRDGLQEKKILPDEHPANYVMMYLTSIGDPGLVICPAHRMLREVPFSQLSQLLDEARKYFEIDTIRFAENERGAAIADFRRRMQPRDEKPAIGFYHRAERAFHVLRLTETAVMDARYGKELPPALRNLDVTILTHLVFIELLGFDQQRLDDERLMGYTTEIREAVEAVHRGDYNAAFILNPTDIRQVCDIADQGLVMPRKATYFYPKVVTGLVINRLNE